MSRVSASSWIAVLYLVGSATPVPAQEADAGGEYLASYDFGLQNCESWDAAKTHQVYDAMMARYRTRYSGAAMQRMRASTEYLKAQRELAAEHALKLPQQMVADCTVFWGASSKEAEATLARLPANDDPSNSVLWQGESLPDCAFLRGEDTDATLYIANGCDVPIRFDYCWQDVGSARGWSQVNHFCSITGWLRSPTVAVGGRFEIDDRPSIQGSSHETKRAAVLKLRHVKKYKIAP